MSSYLASAAWRSDTAPWILNLTLSASISPRSLHIYKARVIRESSEYLSLLLEIPINNICSYLLDNFFEWFPLFSIFALSSIDSFTHYFWVSLKSIRVLWIYVNYINSSPHIKKKWNTKDDLSMLNLKMQKKID